MSEQLQVLERSQEKINEAFVQADIILMRKYMPEIGSYPIKELSSAIELTNMNSVLRMNKIEKIVFDAEENNLDKLMNVYNSVALCGGAIIHIILSDGDSVEYYIGTRTNDINEIATCQSALLGTFEGNFPGSKLRQQDKNGLNACLEKVFSSNEREQGKIISVVSGIPGFRNEDTKEFVQGMEKLIDSMAGKAYAMITIAEPVSDEQLLRLEGSYEELYTQLSPFAKVTQTYSESDSSSLAENISDAVTESVASTVGSSTSKGTTMSHTDNESTSRSKGLSILTLNRGKTTTSGSSDSVSEQASYTYSDSRTDTTGSTRTTGITDTVTTTTGKTWQLVQDNRRVTDLLQKIEKQIERIEDAKDTGLWNTATYCIADDTQTSKILAGTLQALCRGKKNTIENYSINTWTDPYKLKAIESYLKKMVHPVFEMRVGHEQVELSPSSLISGSELLITAGLPQKAVSGISVSKMVSFARNVTIEDDDYQAGERVELGNVFHMGKTEKTTIELDMESLSAHVLITGSTGSGKSNTVYRLLSEVRKKGIPFLIVEPAKGEYKNVFGNDADVTVFGTNSKVAPLLKINPFSFPEDIHVLEHIDRLIEIFNVCWPMYAAMPAILKDAVLQAYQVCGWDLENSENNRDANCYPTFKDVQTQIRNVLDASDYSADNKGDYTGALVTRIHSLTNGINGQMFTADESDSSVIFDKNTIIDLSRIGSQETKALIMGIVVMKLSEYRMSSAKGSMNQPFKHITVLEEAHNLLRNTQGKSSSEGADIAGKSVEMIANSIAEMRTYGEGFVIVDQSPGAIDISAIRNTNTKILMRLPEESDRQQAGKAAALTDNQVPELAKLPKGVAAVYQNNWLDPILCKIRKADVREELYHYHARDCYEEESSARKMIAMLLVGSRMDEVLDISAELIRRNIERLNLSTESRMLICDTLDQLENGDNPSTLEEEAFAKLSEVVCEVIKYDSIKNIVNAVDDVKGVQERIHIGLVSIVGFVSIELELAISQCILRKMVSENKDKVSLYSKWRQYAVERRKRV